VKEGGMSEAGHVALLRKFLVRATYDPDELRESYFGQPSDDFAEVDEAFAAAAERAGLSSLAQQGQPRWVPPKELCRELLLWTDWLEVYGASPGSPPFDQIYIAVRFAMPLVATAESAGGAAG
jgi:hypothetical protein